MVARIAALLASDIGPRSWGELNGHRQQAADERCRPRRGRLVCCEREVRQSLHQLLEHHAKLEPREARPETEVRAAAEGEMLVRRTRHIERLRILEPGVV